MAQATARFRMRRPSKRHAPSMLTTDLALRFDPAYEKISRRFYEHPRAVRGCIRPGMVQADAPRHGPDRRGISARWFRRSNCPGRTRFLRSIIR